MRLCIDPEENGNYALHGVFPHLQCVCVCVIFFNFIVYTLTKHNVAVRFLHIYLFLILKSLKITIHFYCMKYFVEHLHVFFLYNCIKLNNSISKVI